MKLLLMLQGVLFLCFSSAHPQSSLSDGSSWFSNDGITNLGSGISSTISEVNTLFTNGVKTAKQVLESVSEYGEKSMEMAGKLEKTALTAVNNLVEKSTQAVSLGQELLASGTEIVREGIAAVLGVIDQVIQGIQGLASAFG